MLFEDKNLYNSGFKKDIEKGQIAFYSVFRGNETLSLITVYRLTEDTEAAIGPYRLFKVQELSAHMMSICCAFLAIPTLNDFQNGSQCNGTFKIL